MQLSILQLSLIVSSLLVYSLLLSILVYLVSTHSLSKRHLSELASQRVQYELMLARQTEASTSVTSLISQHLSQAQASLASKDPFTYAQILAANSAPVGNTEPLDEYATDEDVARAYLKDHGIELDSDEGRELSGYEAVAFGEITSDQF